MGKGQVFSFDYIAGFVMFIIVLVIAGSQLLNILPSASYETLYQENTYLSNSLMQPGYPNDWNTSNVLVPGIASSNRLDETKLIRYTEFTYDETKSFYHIGSDYVFFFQDKNGIINISNQCMFGFNITINSSCHPQVTALGYANLVTTSRLVIYNSSIMEMVLYSWN